MPFRLPALTSLPPLLVLSVHVQYVFPPQEECLRCLGELAKSEAQRDPSTVFYVGTYTIGKERAVKAVAQVRQQRRGRKEEGGE